MRGIEGGVEDDVDRSTHVSSNRRLRKELDRLGGMKMLKTWIFMQGQYEIYEIIKTQHNEPTQIKGEKKINKKTCEWTTQSSKLQKTFWSRNSKNVFEAKTF